MLYYPKLEYQLLSKERRKVRIYLILRLHLRKKFEAPLPLFINPSYWDAKNERVRLHYRDSYEINNKLLIVKDQLENNTLLDKIKNHKLFKKMVKEISDKYVVKNDLTLLSAIDRYIAFAPQIKNKKTGSIGLKSATVIRYEFLKKIYGEYKIKKEKNILIDCFKISDIDEFTSFLLHEKKYGVGTVGKTISQLKTVLHKAIRDGYPVSNAIKFIEHFGLSKQERILNTLNFEEIELLKSYVPEPHLKNSWKIMLIGLFTGQRVSDLLTLDKSQLRLSQNGNLYIDFIQQKTGVHATVAIGDPLIKEILLDDFPEKTYTQIFNKHLKKICEKAGLTDSVIGYKMNEKTRRKLKGNYRKCDLISAHDLRRSFTTNYYGKVQTPILMRITGHKKESTFLEYIGEKFNQDHYADLFLSQTSNL